MDLCSGGSQLFFVQDGHLLCRWNSRTVSVWRAKRAFFFMCLLTAILQEVPTGEEEEDEIYSQRSKLCARSKPFIATAQVSL